MSGRAFWAIITLLAAVIIAAGTIISAQISSNENFAEEIAPNDIEIERLLREEFDRGYAEGSLGGSGSIEISNGGSEVTEIEERDPPSETVAPVSGVRLSDMTNIAAPSPRLWPARGVSRDNLRINEYIDVLYNRQGDGIRFRSLLNGRYTSVRGTIFVRYGATAPNTTRVWFDMDGRIDGPHELTKTTPPIPIDIDLCGVKEFKIFVEMGGSFAWGTVSPSVHFGDFRFYP